MDVIAGLVLLALGAIGASDASRELQRRGRGHLTPVALVPMGVLIGGGAALVRGWETVRTAIAGAVLVPLVATVVRLVETRRRRARSRAEESIDG